MPENKITILDLPETGQTIDDNTNADAPAPRPKLTRAEQSRMIDTQFRLEHAQGSPEEFPLSKAVAGYRKLVDTSTLPEHLSQYTESLTRTRRTLYDTLDRLRRSHPRNARTQMPNIHNHLDPEIDPQSNPVGLRTNPPSGCPEPEETAA